MNWARALFSDVHISLKGFLSIDKNSSTKSICQKIRKMAKVSIDQIQMRPIKCLEMRLTLKYLNLTYGESNWIFGSETLNSESETNLVFGCVTQ